MQNVVYTSRYITIENQPNQYSGWKVISLNVKQPRKNLKNSLKAFSVLQQILADIYKALNYLLLFNLTNRPIVQ